MDAPGPDGETAVKALVGSWGRLGETCLGHALYRHDTVFRGDSDARLWIHLGLSYFRGLIPNGAILDLVENAKQPAMKLLRAEVLLTTPASFIMRTDWRGLAGRGDLKASLEYIRVEPAFLDDYRNVMRTHCGPAAAKLVRVGTFGTFRAMETAAVLYQDPDFAMDWNQIHLCELDPSGFQGFGPAFTSTVDDAEAAAQMSDAFASLDRVRTVPRWTFNDPVVEADFGLVQLGHVEG
jgi:hypothetical protein